MTDDELKLLTLEVAMSIGGPMLASGMTTYSVIKAAQALIRELDIQATE